MGDEEGAEGHTPNPQQIKCSFCHHLGTKSGQYKIPVLVEHTVWSRGHCRNLNERRMPGAEETQRRRKECLPDATEEVRTCFSEVTLSTMLTGKWKFYRQRRGRTIHRKGNGTCKDPEADGR